MQDILNSIENLIESTNKLFSLIPNSLLTTNEDDSQRAVILAKMRTNQKITEILETENEIQRKLSQLTRLSYKLPEVEKNLPYAYKRIDIVMENITRISMKLLKLEEEINTDILKNNIIDDFGQEFDDFKSEINGKIEDREYKIRSLESSIEVIISKLLKMEVEHDKFGKTIKSNSDNISSIQSALAELTMYKLKKI